MEKIKTKTAGKKVCKQPRKHSVQEILKNEKIKVLEDEDKDSDSDCIVLGLRK